MKILLQNSIYTLSSDKRAKKMRYHFTINEEDFHKNSKLLINLAKKNNKIFDQIMQHFQKI